MSLLILLFLVITFVIFFPTVVLSLNDRLALRWLRWRVKRPRGNRWSAIPALGTAALCMGIVPFNGDPGLLFLSLLFVTVAILQVLLRAFAMLYAEESPPAKG